ncbi:U-scoloptoxin(16)-Ssd1a-like [Drosophila albomicans]|uniref:U-scoloptoxin(16)-Ssd1a-like n=1 Tax=Drosophila albomicans TaxID=7291 RepID=A0A6P8WDV5_DROAB|nr:U-scoloptoxin(16)-Ssd1a-like [Drosophila albomicans]
MKQFMSGILLVLLAALLLPHTEAAVMRGVFADPAHPGKCVVKPNLILNPGQVAQYPAITCARIICEDNSHAQIHTCGVEAAPPGCHLGEPKFPNADYPKCCQREIICN